MISSYRGFDQGRHGHCWDWTNEPLWSSMMYLQAAGDLSLLALWTCVWAEKHGLEIFLECCLRVLRLLSQGWNWINWRKVTSTPIKKHKKPEGNGSRRGLNCFPNRRNAGSDACKRANVLWIPGATQLAKQVQLMSGSGWIMLNHLESTFNLLLLTYCCYFLFCHLGYIMLHHLT